MTTKHEVLRVHLPEWMACKGDKKKRGELIKKISQTIGMNKKHTDLIKQRKKI